MAPGPCGRAAPAPAPWWLKGRCALVVASLSKGGISWVWGAHRIGESESWDWGRWELWEGKGAGSTVMTSCLEFSGLMPGLGWAPPALPPITGSRTLQRGPSWRGPVPNAFCVAAV